MYVENIDLMPLATFTHYILPTFGLGAAVVACFAMLAVPRALEQIS